AARLESVASDEKVEGYSLPLTESADRVAHGDWRPLLRAVLADLRRGVRPSRITARFHQALADWAVAVAARHPGRQVVLGGGCFQNPLLLERTRDALHAVGRRVDHAGHIPPNDGGLAAGQLAVALARMTG